ncbi:ATP-dependent DNA helicase [Paraburkholderia strydomiana]|uniref:ATP-dependent DNA helicase n=1 Tax=Paraburkholderia strydomiana TaxID=1245417 RepID=UPI0038B6B2A5
MSEVRLVRVSSIRTVNPKGFGGCIFYGPTIDTTGNVLDAREHVVVVLSHELGIVGVQVGQWWRVTGNATRRERTINGYLVVEQQVHAEGAELALPSGEHLVTFIAESHAFPGVGMVKARKLWETFGERLYRLLDDGDESTLSTSVSPEAAQALVHGWKCFGNARTLSWLSLHGLDVGLGKKVVDYFGAEAPEAISEDPYRLLSFCASWHVTDRLARGHFEVDEDDPRRLRGAIEETLYRLFGDGHTAATDAMVMTRLASVLGGDVMLMPRSLARSALESGLQHGSFVVTNDGMLHPLGAYVMETTVASALAHRLAPLSDETDKAVPAHQLDDIISAFEAEEGITLTPAQRAAVHLAANSRLCLILGGAGVGKTTVLKCIYRAYDVAGVRVIQTALAGRAAKRMESATQRPARTLASLLHQRLDDSCSAHCVVVDEASMVDIITMYHLCMQLPNHARLLLVGDPMQLMPVGPGMVLHALDGNPAVPQVKLDVSKRFSGRIADVADAVRRGQWPEIPNDLGASVAFLRQSPVSSGTAEPTTSALLDTVLKLYREAPASTQILCAIKGGKSGVRALNLACQSGTKDDAPRLTIWNSEIDTLCDTGLRRGDPIVCTRNLPHLGLQNGALGTLVEIAAEPQAVCEGDSNLTGHAIAWIQWDDGQLRPVFGWQLDDLALAYALTVHKAQGSQWERVIFVVTGGRLLDRTLIYTAITRAQKQVILVGDEDAAMRATVAEPRVSRRITSLRKLTADMSPLS